jgi:hypothetical protein
MKTNLKPLRCHGFLELDLLIGLAILALAIVPLGFSFTRERQALKHEYLRAVADEIVDGEMEILAAGGGNDIPDGVQNYSVHCRAATALPPGNFRLTKAGKHLRLEWSGDAKCGVSTVAREAELP